MYIRRLKFRRKATTHMQSRLKQRRSIMTPLEFAASPGYHDVKEKDVVDELDPTTRSTMIEERKFVMNKHI